MIINGDSLIELKKFDENSIDLTVTSPPYDNLRTYNGNNDLWNEDVWKGIIQELYRVTKDGGVVVWVVGDATIKGSETGTSFKQALWAMECGFNLHDTMIWNKPSCLPTQDRYYNVFEYMFVFSKRKPKSMNFICDNENVSKLKKQKKDKVIAKDNPQKSDEYFMTKKYSRRKNIWKIPVTRNNYGHRAVFPEQLAHDHIISWSNEGDTVLDPFMGSGTTGKMALKNNRKFIGIELDPDYCKIAEARIASVSPQNQYQS